MSARNGKIARLPRELRDELNRRLDDGVDGVSILNWINTQPAAHQVFAALFHGQPISAQNLSEWRQGGFLEWQRRQESLALIRGFCEQGEEFDAAVAGPFTDRLSGILSSTLFHSMLAATLESKQPPRMSDLIGLTREVARLRRSDRDHERSVREQAEWLLAQPALEREALRQKRLAEKEAILAPLDAAKELGHLHCLYQKVVANDDEAGRNILAQAAHTKFGLPGPEPVAPASARRKPRSNQTESK